MPPPANFVMIVAIRTEKVMVRLFLVAANAKVVIHVFYI